MGKAKALKENKFYEAKNICLDQFVFSAENDEFLKGILKLVVVGV